MDAREIVAGLGGADDPFGTGPCTAPEGLVG